MKNNRGRIAIATGAVLGLAVLVGQPALATGDNDRAAPQVTSAQIKNGTIKPKDVNAKIRASLARADSALQGIGLGSIGSAQLADNSVGSSEVATDSLTAGDLSDNSVGTGELASNSVTTADVQNGGLVSADISAQRGVVQFDFDNLASGACDTEYIASGNTSLTGDLIMVTPGSTWLNGLTVTPRPQNLGGSIAVVVCNTANVALDAPNTDFGWAVFEN